MYDTSGIQTTSVGVKEIVVSVILHEFSVIARLTLVAMLGLSAGAAAAGAEAWSLEHATAAAGASFEHDIKPLLTSYCLPCHKADKHKEEERIRAARARPTTARRLRALF